MKISRAVISVSEKMGIVDFARQLEAMGVELDVLTDEQVKYLNSWEEGT